MKINEIKELETKDLVERIESEETRLHQMKLNHAITPLENPMQLRAVKKDIARMKTVLRQRELNK
ncbi:MAG: 50S ribosomal protein L29 [Prevotella sp.]|nr:50S ribosomal protein L29 [Prevotella sp.]